MESLQKIISNRNACDSSKRPMQPLKPNAVLLTSKSGGSVRDSLTLTTRFRTSSTYGMNIKNSSRPCWTMKNPNRKISRTRPVLQTWNARWSMLTGKLNVALPRQKPMHKVMFLMRNGKLPILNGGYGENGKVNSTMRLRTLLPSVMSTSS